MRAQPIDERADECLADEQLAPAMRRPRRPELELMEEIMASAFVDIDSGEELLIRDVQAWMGGAHAPVKFVQCCDYLGLEPGAVRAAAKARMMR